MSIKFSNESPFFAELRKRVDEYFRRNGLRHTGNYKLYSKGIILFITLAAIYATLVFFTPAWWLSLPLCILAGINLAAIGFNVMHDGAHGSYSRRKGVNAFMGFSLNIMGGNVDLWKQKHNVCHHSYTNVEGMDDDIDIKPFIRVHPEQKKFWFHRFQHWYALFLYGFTYLFWVFYLDFQKYFSGRIGQVPLRKMSFISHLNFWASKALHTVVFIVLPVLFAGLPATLLGYGIAVFMAGIVLSVVFQLAHVVEGVTFVPEHTVNDRGEWALHQLSTTVNFSTWSKTLNWLLGGLNFQVEHHLFPQISHVHYPRINRIVKSTCREYNVEYREHPNFFRAFRSHLRHLKTVGASA